MSDTVAFIDVGTNSIHMLIVRFFEGSMGATVFQEKETVRMGKSLYECGLLDGPTLEKAGVVFRKFSEIARDHGATEIVAMATCAAREAPNRGSLVDLAAECGFELHIIPGKEEARLTRLGVAGPVCEKRTLCIDIGGGSTEISLAHGDKDLYLDSLSLGAIRMAFGSGVDQHGRVSQSQYESLKRMVDTQCYNTAGIVRDLGFEVALGSSGTIEAIADACATIRGDGDATYVLHSEVRNLMKKMCSMTAEERCKLPKVSPNRADIVIGGGVVLDELMELFGVKRINVCRTGLREGMKVDYLLSHGHSHFNQRESSVRALAVRCGCARKHEESVVRYAVEMYSEFVRIGLMPVSHHMEELLKYAAQLHDIGTFINYDKHHVLSYTIIRNSYLAGFDSEELEKVALLVRFHHGGFPDSSNKLLAGRSAQDVMAIRRYALILKMADIMDRGRDDAISEISAEILNGNVNLTLIANSDINLAMWKLKSVTGDFQSVFGSRLNIEHLRT